MSDVDLIIKNIGLVAQAAKDEAAKKIVQAKQMNRLNVEQSELTLLLQVVNAAIDSSFNNSSQIIKKVAQKQLDAAYDEGARGIIKKK